MSQGDRGPFWGKKMNKNLPLFVNKGLLLSGIRLNCVFKWNQKQEPCYDRSRWVSMHSVAYFVIYQRLHVILQLVASSRQPCRPVAPDFLRFGWKWLSVSAAPAFQHNQTQAVGSFPHFAVVCKVIAMQHVLQNCISCTTAHGNGKPHRGI